MKLCKRSNGLETRLAAKVIVTQLGFDLLSPEMVVIRAGTFRMGDLERKHKDELPDHEVTLQKDFKLGKYEVTFDDYEPFVKATGHNNGMIDHRGWGTGRRPAIYVSWDDAKEYVNWLSTLTGKHYRLPTEAEWEYAARSGAQQQTWVGTSEESELKQYAVFNQNSGSRTAEVGSKKQNGFGLHDMTGNVEEWVEDCWHENYQGAPADGSAWLKANGANCRRPVVRGGSWNYGPGLLRVSDRIWYLAGLRNFDIGFRLAQDIP